MGGYYNPYTSGFSAAHMAAAAAAAAAQQSGQVRSSHQLLTPNPIPPLPNRGRTEFSNDKNVSASL